eukprot:TRINITY_DN3288_c0_g1_i1.p1 TRINITY_DN3288_c0_g1~~TRINITY_DN3288_c0_g1_i1.p1  ORF type:complete len:425 (+),score=85.70 TRINITY_DN3288_c0_g1_i1:42-1316(+)
MAAMKVFGGRGSGYLTPDPFILPQSDETGKTKDAGLDAAAESGSQTPKFISEVDMEAVQSKLERFQIEKEHGLLEFSMGPPPGLSNNGLDADVMKVAMSRNLQPPYPVFGAVPPPPVPHPEFVRHDRSPALKAKPVKSHMMSEQVVSKGSVGHPFKCAPACRYVKRKGGCRDGEDCPSCHHCFWSKAHTAGEEESLAKPQVEDDAKLREAKNLANRLVSLLGGEAPFGVQSKAQETVKPEISLGTMGHPHTCAEPCKYVRRKGGCMHGKACANCHACEWSRSSGQKAQAEAASFFGNGYGKAMQEWQDLGLGSVLDFDGLLTDPYEVPVLSTNPTWGQPRPFPRSQGAPQQVPPRVQQQAPWSASAAQQVAQGAPQQVPWSASVGSMGHPYSCGPACKYAMKAKGCKDGAMCDHCHLCRWMRYG